MMLAGNNNYNYEEDAQAEVWLWKLGGVLAIGAGIWMSLVFWYSLAERPADIPSHLAIGLLTHVLIIAGGFSMVSGWREKRMGRVGLSVLVAGVCFCLNCLNQMGFYGHSAAIAAARAQGAERLESLDDGAVTASQARVESARAQLKSLTDAQAAATGKGMITKARETYGPQITAANAELKAASEALQGAQSTAKETTTKTKPEAVGSASGALFKLLGHLTDRTPEDARAEFLFLLPFVHECLSLAGSIVLATFGRGKKAGKIAPVSAGRASDSPPGSGQGLTRPAAAAALMAAPVMGTAQAHEPAHVPPHDPPPAASEWTPPAAVMVPASSVAQPTAVTAPEAKPAPTAQAPEAETQAQAQAVGINDYIRELFARWTPEKPLLTGRDAIKTRLGLSAQQKNRMHELVAANPHYQVNSANNQPFSMVDMATFAAAMPKAA